MALRSSKFWSPNVVSLPVVIDGSSSTLGFPLTQLSPLHADVLILVASGS